MSTVAQTREEILQEISQHETRIFELRQLLPSALKSFFRFRCRPEKFVWVYALTHEEAVRKLHARMNLNYGANWEVASRVVDRIDDPREAANTASCNLLTHLTLDDAREFVNDYRANQRGRATGEKLKHAPQSRIEQDIESWELNQRRREGMKG
ncbi:hypothetical protein [Blastopirellula marina]|uniref:Uncharacterized protein n=1 Tax=Blastopirellula marina DSM 3645 TaxID=314230 RepID=A3ZPR4_9BACT|nr:hypothetical protein [Blastopirellula marina]EAQ81742.1 hypothetical protein DSM3645_29212 [Blastopirellula marina DSM 3645]